jgi:predicted nucleic acid-binding protein
MSLADACLVRMAELHDDAAVITVDRDFAVYRKHGRQAIPLVSPLV